MLFNFNWIDIIVVAIFLRGVIGGLKSNIVIEVFRLIGIFCATFITLHYYSQLGKFLTNNAFIPEAIHEVVAFVLIWVTVAFVFKLIGEGWKLLLRVETNPLLEKWGAMFFSLTRSYFICGLTFMMFFVTGNEYFGKVANRSFSENLFVDLSPRVYKFCYDGFVGKFFPREKPNTKIFKLKELGKKEVKKKK